MKQIKKSTALIKSQNRTVLPALKTNNLVFEIFSFNEQLEALIILRSLSRKCLEKS